MAASSLTCAAAINTDIRTGAQADRTALSHPLFSPLFFSSSIRPSADHRSRQRAGRVGQLHHHPFHVVRSEPAVHQRHQPGLQGQWLSAAAAAAAVTCFDRTVRAGVVVSHVAGWRGGASGQTLNNGSVQPFVRRRSFSLSLQPFLLCFIVTLRPCHDGCLHYFVTGSSLSSAAHGESHTDTSTGCFCFSP